MPKKTSVIVPVVESKAVISWKVEQLTSQMVSGALEKVVIGLCWRATATKGNFQSTLYNSITFQPPDPDSFIVYADLNEETVLGWVWASGVNKEECELYLLDSIKQQELPPVVACLPLPWA